jgi:hypothetical protein
VVLLIFPTTNAFIRQHKIGVVQIAKEAAEQRNLKVRMLMPKHESTEPLVRSLTEDPHHYRKYDIDVRYYIEQTTGTKATILGSRQALTTLVAPLLMKAFLRQLVHNMGSY